MFKLLKDMFIFLFGLSDEYEINFKDISNRFIFNNKYGVSIDIHHRDIFHIVAIIKDDISGKYKIKNILSYKDLYSSIAGSGFEKVKLMDDISFKFIKLFNKYKLYIYNKDKCICVYFKENKIDYIKYKNNIYNVKKRRNHG